MELHNVRNSIQRTLAQKGMTQEAFARKHDLSSSWLNKFLRGEVDNPQLRSLERVQRALEAERAG